MEKNQDVDEMMDYLLRDIPREVMGKLRAAAAIHNRSVKTYIRELFETHLQELERKGITLSVGKEGRGKKTRG